MFHEMRENLRCYFPSFEFFFNPFGIEQLVAGMYSSYMDVFQLPICASGKKGLISWPLIVSDSGKKGLIS